MQKLTDNVVAINRRTVKVSEETLDSVFRQYHHVLKAFLRRFVHSEDEVADLVQDVYERLCKQTLKDDWKQFPKSYILKTATSVLRDKIRRNVVRHEHAHDTLEDHEPAVSESDPRQSLENMQGINIIKQAVQDLPAKQRQVFLLHRIQNQTLKSISNEMDIPLRTIERYLSQALVLCHKRLKRAQWLGEDE